MRLHKVDANDILFVPQAPNCNAGDDSPREGIVLFKLSQNSGISGLEMFEKSLSILHKEVVVVLFFLFQIVALASWQQAEFSETPSTGDRMRSP